MDKSKMAMMRTTQTSLMLASCVQTQTAEEEESNNQIFSGLNEIFSRTGSRLISSLAAAGCRWREVRQHTF